MNNHYDVVIVGAGPGGLQVGVTLEELNAQSVGKISYLIVEKSDAVAASFKEYPVHRKLISINKVYCGMDARSSFAERFDWHSLVTEDKSFIFPDVSRDFFPDRDELTAYLSTMAEKYNLNIQFNTECSDISKRDEKFLIKTNTGDIVATKVVIATGLTAYTPGIKGCEYAMPYKSMPHRTYYRNKRVLILGKGNSAMECAQDILNEASVVMLAAPSTTRLAYQTHYVGDVRVTNMLMVENYQLKMQSALLDCQVKSIVPYKDGYNVTVAYAHAEDEVETIFYHHVITATGFVSHYEHLTSSLNLSKINKKYPAIDYNFESTDVDGLYFAGVQTHGLDYRKTFSGFIHGFRYNSQILANHLAHEFGISRVKKTLGKQELCEHLVSILSVSSHIYLQPGFVVYVVELIKDKMVSLGYMTLDKFKQDAEFQHRDLLAVSLEYGDINKFHDVLNIPRSPGNPNASVHIHPVIRIRKQKSQLEFNLEELLESDFMNSKPHYAMLQNILTSHFYSNITELSEVVA